MSSKSRRLTTTSGKPGATGPRRTGTERGRATATAFGPGGAVAGATGGAMPASSSDPSWPRTADILATPLELAQLYGDGETGTPSYAARPTSFPTGSGTSVATSAELNQALYQQNQAAAYHGSDTAPAKCLDGLAGTNARRLLTTLIPAIGNAENIER